MAHLHYLDLPVPLKIPSHVLISAWRDKHIYSGERTSHFFQSYFEQRFLWLLGRLVKTSSEPEFYLPEICGFKGISSAPSFVSLYVFDYLQVL